MIKTFSNLDYQLFDQYMDDRKFLNLEMVSFKVVDDSDLELTLSGNKEMLTSFNNFLQCESNWA
jgi:hypothetical protein